MFARNVIPQTLAAESLQVDAVPLEHSHIVGTPTVQATLRSQRVGIDYTSLQARKQLETRNVDVLSSRTSRVRKLSQQSTGCRRGMGLKLEWASVGTRMVSVQIISWVV
jgi:hypothetical protein